MFKHGTRCLSAVQRTEAVVPSSPPRSRIQPLAARLSQRPAGKQAGMTSHNPGRMTHTHTHSPHTYTRPIQCSGTERNTLTPGPLHASHSPGDVSKSPGRCWQVSADILVGVSAMHVTSRRNVWSTEKRLEARIPPLFLSKPGLGQGKLPKPVVIWLQQGQACM